MADGADDGNAEGRVQGLYPEIRGPIPLVAAGRAVPLEEEVAHF